jgi:hypothetical protein
MITYAEVKDKLLKLAEENPDYVFNTDPRAVARAEAEDPESVRTDKEGNPYSGTCYYRFSDGEPACIVGRVIASYVPDAVFTEGNTADMAVKEIFGENKVEAWVIDLLMHAQDFQDLGTPWGTAVEDALRTVEEMKSSFGVPVYG